MTMAIADSQRMVILLEGRLIGGDRDHPRRTCRRTEQDGGGKDGKGLHESKAEGDGKPRHQQRQEDFHEPLTRVGAKRCRRLFYRRIDAGHIGQRQKESEGKTGDHQRGEDAPVVVGQLHRRIQQPDKNQHAVEPALRPEKRQKSVGNENRAERDRQNEDRRQQTVGRVISRTRKAIGTAKARLTIVTGSASQSVEAIVRYWKGSLKKVA